MEKSNTIISYSLQQTDLHTHKHKLYIQSNNFDSLFPSNECDDESEKIEKKKIGNFAHRMIEGINNNNKMR